MSLTSISDIAVLYEKLNNLSEKLVETELFLQNQIIELQNIIFEGRILQEKDLSWGVVRRKRDYLLKSTDWTVTPGSTLDQGAWASYRQILRDLPQTYKKGGLKSLKWPKQPPTSGPNTIDNNE